MADTSPVSNPGNRSAAKYEWHKRRGVTAGNTARIPRFLAGVTIGIIGSACFFAPVRATPAPANAAQCEAIEREDFSYLSDAPAQILSARPAAATSDYAAYCEVSGYVAPQVGFLLRLPMEGWNGKLLQLGCGGHCGSTDHIRQCADPLRRGYACIVTDDGHQSNGAQALWAYNNWQSQIDYFVRAPHVTALAGKAIIERYYRAAPKKAYFMGCSAGGREAMMEAQRFPWDFDGIIAGAPSLNQIAIRMNMVWGRRALSDSTGSPLLEPADIDLLHRAVVAKCDLNDGVGDGLIGDPRQCAFDPTELLCTAARKGPCLTTQQVAGVKKMYAGMSRSTSEQIYWPGAMRGSEKTWLPWFGKQFDGLVEEAFRYYAFDPNPGPSWKAQDFNFDRDSRRLGVAEGLYAAINPDLRRFKAAGGKLLSYAGWNDAIGMPLPVIDYYESAEKVMGGRAATQAFYRLFMIPGMNHCTGGDGAFAVDYLSYLENWVERGQAPDKLIGSHVTLKNAADGLHLSFPLDPKTIQFSRPAYPYPTTAKYRRGNPNDAASFGPVTP